MVYSVNLDLINISDKIKFIKYPKKSNLTRLLFYYKHLQDSIFQTIMSAVVQKQIVPYITMPVVPELNKKYFHDSISFILMPVLLISVTCTAQKNTGPEDFTVIGYYLGRTTMIDSFEVEKLTHLIFSFCHLKGEALSVRNARDSSTILRMVELKKRNPQLKVLLSLGGWGGCQRCSAVFSARHGRRIFARSVKQLDNYFGTDGIDLDWEYPVVAGFPGHAYSPADKPNFTALITQLRKKLGKKKGD